MLGEQVPVLKAELLQLIKVSPCLLMHYAFATDTIDMQLSCL